MATNIKNEQKYKVIPMESFLVEKVSAIACYGKCLKWFDFLLNKFGIKTSSFFSDMNLLVATSNGSLRNYSIVENSQQITHKILYVEENFSAKPITQISVIAESQLLFSLIDNTIRIHKITHDHRFEYFETLEEMNVSLFACNSKRTIDSADLIIRICVATENKLKIWFLNSKQNQLTPYKKSMELDSIVKSIGWHKNDICVATERGYTIYNVSIYFVWCSKFRIIYSLIN